MRFHYVLAQATCSCLPFFLSSFILGVNGQTGVSSSIPSSLSTQPPSSSPMSSSTSGVSLGVTGTPTGSADFPTLSGYSACVTNCLAVAVASRDCSSITTPECYCNGTNVEGFKQRIILCLSSDCPQELSTGEQLAQRFCNVGPSSTSISFPPLPPSLSSVSSSSSSSPSLTTSPSSTLSSPTGQTSGGSNSNGASSWRGTWGMAGSTVVLIGLGSIFVGAVSL